MANPYSTPSEYTPRNFNMLEKFGDLAAKKEAEYQASQAAMGKLMADMPTQEGFLTPGLIKEVNSDYTQRILSVQDQLMRNKDVNEAQRNLSKIAAQYQQDNRVLSGARDAERSKTMPLWRLENQGAFVGYENPDGSPIAIDFKTITPSQIDQYYANVAKAPDWKEEDAMWLHMTPEERTKLSGLQMLPPTETGEIFFWDGTKKQSLRDLSANGNYPTLTAVSNDLYYTKATTASNFYNKSGKGLNSYVTDFFERGRLFNINNTDESKTYRASALNNGSGSGSGSGSGKDPLAPKPIEWVTNPAGYVESEGRINPDKAQEQRQSIPKLQAEIDNLKLGGNTKEAEIKEKELAAMETNVAAYDVAKYEWEKSTAGQKKTEELKQKYKADDSTISFANEGLETVMQMTGASGDNFAKNFATKENLNNIMRPFGEFQTSQTKAVQTFLNQKGMEFNFENVENFLYSVDKNNKIAEDQHKEIKEYIKTDVINEIQTFSATNATDEYREQINSTLRAGATNLDWTGAELINSSNGKYQGVEFKSDETKGKALAALVSQGFTPEEMKTFKLELDGDGAYFSINLDRHLADNEWDNGNGATDNTVDDEFQMVTNEKGKEVGRSILRMKINKDELYKDITQRGSIKSSNHKLLELLAQTTTLTNSGAGGFTHLSEMADAPKAVIMNMFTPGFNNSKKNYKEQLEEFNAVVTKMGGVVDDQFMNNQIIKGKQVKYGDGDAVSNGLRVERGNNPDALQTFDTGDYLQSMGSQPLDIEKDAPVIGEYINSILLSDLKSTGTQQVTLEGGGFNIPYGQPIKDPVAVSNLVDGYVKNNPNFTLTELNLYLSKFINGIEDAPFTFADKSSFSRYLTRGSEKKSIPQGSANPLGIK
jgi:hypothetical protein